VASPLKLKRQATTNSKKISAEVAPDLPIAAVLVDTPVSHLEGIYDYLVPIHLSDLAIVGSKVLVEFGKSKTEALIIDRKSESEQKQGIKQVLDVISPPG
jgi:primosomal protein N' (replication factor Y)